MPKSKHRKNRKPYDKTKVLSIGTRRVTKDDYPKDYKESNGSAGVVLNKNGAPTIYYTTSKVRKVGRKRELKDILKVLKDNNVSLSKRIKI